MKRRGKCEIYRGVVYGIALGVVVMCTMTI